MQFDAATLVLASSFSFVEVIFIHSQVYKWQAGMEERGLRMYSAVTSQLPSGTQTLFTFHQEAKFEMWINHSSQQKLGGDKWECEEEARASELWEFIMGQKIFEGGEIAGEVKISF